MFELVLVAFPFSSDAVFSRLYSLEKLILSLEIIFLPSMELRRLLYSLSRPLLDAGWRAWLSESRECQM